ncbi:hypothetical protein EYF80_030440 [Liparis tanakae]|uniref:Uncharacterized protein n=1 Tax=Liparis tanakae TaxID=230148 RepID=A0A4Z2H0F4_9TELE|nr:hypothetical protein EYF80_030440 [Liparis tanakae]
MSDHFLTSSITELFFERVSDPERLFPLPLTPEPCEVRLADVYHPVLLVARDFVVPRNKVATLVVFTHILTPAAGEPSVLFLFTREHHTKLHQMPDTISVYPVFPLDLEREKGEQRPF